MNNFLSKNEIIAYRQQGFLLIKNFFDEERVAASLRAINEITNQNNIKSIAELEPRDDSKIRRIWAPTAKHKFFADMARDAKLLDAIANLIGENIIFHYSKLNMKAPFISSPVAWHQDFAYNPHTNTDLITCLIYLDDADIHNGCLQVIPGSHKNGMYNHFDSGYFTGKVVEENIPDKFPIINLEANAGSVIFLHCLTLHKSSANKSKKPRRSFLPSYRAADSYPIYVGSYTGDLEPTTQLIRGQISKTARVEAGEWPLPLAEKKFNSLFEIQEGSHLQNDKKTKSGYFGHTLKNH